MPDKTSEPLPAIAHLGSESGVSPQFAEEQIPAALRFPGEDGGRSLVEMAQRDLDAALQLLTERAQYITAASGAAIALREGSRMVCRASAGASAPELGTHLQIDSGLSGESVRTRQILRCDNAETDSRVNRESCRALGIASVVVMPVQAADEVVGVFELFSEKADAFDERDIAALERMGEMIHTALAHALAAAEPMDASRDPTILQESEAEGSVGGTSSTTEVVNPREPELLPSAALVPEPDLSPVSEDSAPPVLANGVKIGKCEQCGFPISPGRTLCVDCQSAQDPKNLPQVLATGNASIDQRSKATEDSVASEAPTFLQDIAEEESWLSSHRYLIGILFAAAIIAALVLLSRLR